MGHKKKGCRTRRSLHQQAYDRLQSMQTWGDSKREDKTSDPAAVRDKIYSFSSYKTYFQQIKQFLRWVKEHHPETQNLKEARQYRLDWLQKQVDAGASSWTISTASAALNKLYGIHPEDPDYFTPPKRRKADIVRSRGPKVRDKHFSEEKNAQLVNFCRGVGPRINVLKKLQSNDLYTREQAEATLAAANAKDDKATIKALTEALKLYPDQDYFVRHYRDKNGKTRFAPIVGPHKAEIIERFHTTPPGKKVWEYVNTNADIHSYRADYATYLYKLIARPIKNLHYRNKILCSDGKYRSEIYVCRGVDRGKKLDRRAIHLISVALGHGREDTAIANYIRNL